MFKMKYGTWKNLTSSHWEDVENNWKLLEISFVIVCNLNIYFSQNFMFLAGCDSSWLPFHHIWVWERESREGVERVRTAKAT